MSKIVIFGARGRLGRLTVAEALRRGHEVTAVTRDGAGLEPANGLRIAAGEIVDTDGIAALATGHDVGISTIGPRIGDSHEQFSDNIQTMLAGLHQAGVSRGIIVGGAGSSEVADGTLLIDTPDFPTAAKPRASSVATALRRLRASQTSVDWAFMSPPAFFDPAGERTGTYRLGTENLISDDEGSYLSYADGAVVLIDEVEQLRHHFTRFTVGR